MSSHQQYGGQYPSYGQYPPQQYTEHADAYYNPYDDPQPHQTYDQSGYNGPAYNGGYEGGYRDEPAPPPLPSKEVDKEATAVNVLSRASRGPKTSSAMRRWRYEHQGNLWTRGGRGRCVGRFCCCTIMIFIFLLVSIVLSLALWIKPPNVTIGSPAVPTSGSAIQVQSNGVSVNLDVDIGVNNPNYFSVNFNEISASLTYPLDNTGVGGGTLKNIDIKSNAQTNFTFPFSLNYTFAEDPNFAVLNDIASRCGVGSNPNPSQLTVDYKITLAFKVLFIPIKPSISNSFSFACPISSDEINSLLNSAGINLGNVANL